eukprot:gene19621-biopygen20541
MCSGQWASLQCQHQIIGRHASKRRSMRRLNVQRSTVIGNGEFCEFVRATACSVRYSFPTVWECNFPVVPHMYSRSQPSTRAISPQPTPSALLPAR